MTFQQPTLFDKTKAVTDKAVKAAGDNADAYWKECCMKSILHLCHNMYSFTSDDIHEYMAKWYPEAQTPDKRAMGAMMRQADTNGWCEHSNTFVPSKRTVCHRNPKAVWRSLLMAV